MNNVVFASMAHEPERVSGDEEDAGDLVVDLAVVGSGGGGLAAAIVAHDHGLRAVVLERADTLGGGTALATGGHWFPNNQQQQAAGIADSREAALAHLLATARGEHIPESREIAEAYVDHCIEAVQYLEAHTPLRFEALLNFPDYRARLPGASRGRTMVPALFPVRSLGEAASWIRRGPVTQRVSLKEADERGGSTRFQPSPELLAQRERDDVRAGGGASIAALLKACLDRGIEIRRRHRAQRLVVEDGRVAGVEVEHDGRIIRIGARRGVLLSTGGADWDAVNTRRNVQRPYDGPATPPANAGDGHRMGMVLGLPVALMHDASWTPAFQLPGERYEGGLYFRPCLRERNLPHTIVINRAGQRFGNESLPYNDFVNSAVHAWDGDAYTYPNVPMFLVLDSQYRARYPIAGIRPGEPDPAWLTAATSLPELASRLGIDGPGLAATVACFNASARQGEDPVFHRGGDEYQRYYGDVDHRPHPNLGPLDTPPYYGVQLHVSAYGSKGGLITDGVARVIDQVGHPVPGLYAVGNVAASFQHNIGYTGGGVLGRALVFGYLAATHLASGAS
ncbi:MAG: FAD-dependent oxidoreductase [Chloroflexi bacterium]|nr:FAD-dependent oxidoreductase [Chloroflexota bacterium]